MKWQKSSYVLFSVIGLVSFRSVIYICDCHWWNKLSPFYYSAVRQDLTLLYAFCRVTDDMVDNKQSVELKKNRLNVITEFFHQLFANRENVSAYTWKSRNNCKPSIDWKYFERQLTQKQLCAFRGIARISGYMPQEPFYELVNGYKWDIDGRAVLHENDLIEYSEYVASSVATLCTFIFCHKCSQWPDEMGPKCRLMLENARKMGLVSLTKLRVL